MLITSILVETRIYDSDNRVKLSDFPYDFAYNYLTVILWRINS